MDDKKAFEIALLCLEQVSALFSFLKDDERRMEINQAAYHLRNIMRERRDGGGVRGDDKEKWAAKNEELRQLLVAENEKNRITNKLLAEWAALATRVSVERDYLREKYADAITKLEAVGIESGKSENE